MDRLAEYWAHCHGHGSFLLAVRTEAGIEAVGNTCPECGRLPHRITVKDVRGDRGGGKD